jgi:hypothetical protein
MDNSRKRQRVNSNTDSAAPHMHAAHLPAHPPALTAQIPVHHLKTYIDGLYDHNSALIKSLLFQYASLRPDIAEILRYNYDSTVGRERACVINFDHYSKQVWHDINSNYSDLSGSKQYEMSWEVFGQTCETITNIAAAAAGAASFGTRRSALETLRKIGKTICLSSNDTLGHEVQKQFNSCSDSEDAMLAILEHMTEAERRAMMAGDDGRGHSFLNQLLELQSLADDNCVFPNLKDVIAELKNEYDETETETETESETEDELVE